MSDLFGNKEIVEKIKGYVMEKVEIALREAFIKFGI